MKTKVIIETGCNHNGKMDIAIDMINQAKTLGAWSVKFQKRDIESIPDNVKTIKRDINTSFGPTYYEHRAALEFDFDQMRELKNYTEEMGMVFSCSVFDIPSYEFIQSIGCKYIKLPSQLLLDERFLINKNKRDFKIIVSTGMHNQEEILKSKWKESADIVLHCISVYPCLTRDLNLNTIELLRYEWMGEVGYSSHDKHGYGIPFAVIAGAKYVERHFTLDTKMKGSDHGTVSSDVTEMTYIMERIREMEMARGEGRKLSEKEKAVRKIYRGF